MNQRDCKKCVYYGGKRKGKVFCLNDKCVREKDRNRRKGNRYGSKNQPRNQKLYRVNVF